jgi:hypothetical protein
MTWKEYSDIMSKKEAWIVNEFTLSAVVVDTGWDRLPCTVYVRISGGELKVTIDKYCSFPSDYKKLKQGDQVVMSGYITMGNYYDNNYGDVVLIVTAVSLGMRAEVQHRLEVER